MRQDKGVEKCFSFSPTKQTQKYQFKRKGRPYVKFKAAAELRKILNKEKMQIFTSRVFSPKKVQFMSLEELENGGPI
jgi:hypothetical protein